MDALPLRPVVLTEEVRAQLSATSTATLTAQLQRRGIRSTFLSGLRPTRPDLREVARDAAEQEAEETFALERVAAGESSIGVFPLTKERRAEFDAWRAERGKRR